MLPDDNPKTAEGVKKPSFVCVPPVALLHLAHAMMNGANKYGRMNWREHTVTSSIYYDAAMRHLLSWVDGETYDRQSGLHHLAHVMACCAILLDAESLSRLNDDRPGFSGVAAELCQQTNEVTPT
jgi:hypothetical protein